MVDNFNNVNNNEPNNKANEFIYKLILTQLGEVAFAKLGSEIVKNVEKILPEDKRLEQMSFQFEATFRQMGNSVGKFIGNKIDPSSFTIHEDITMPSAGKLFFSKLLETSFSKVGKKVGYQLDSLVDSKMPLENIGEGFGKISGNIIANTIVNKANDFLNFFKD